MKRLLFVLALVGIGAVALLGAVNAQAQDTPLPKEEVLQKGVEVLTRGPIHEAFA